MSELLKLLKSKLDPFTGPTGEKLCYLHVLADQCIFVLQNPQGVEREVVLTKAELNGSTVPVDVYLRQKLFGRPSTSLETL